MVISLRFTTDWKVMYCRNKRDNMRLIKNNILYKEGYFDEDY